MKRGKGRLHGTFQLHRPHVKAREMLLDRVAVAFGLNVDTTFHKPRHPSRKLLSEDEFLLLYIFNL